MDKLKRVAKIIGPMGLMPSEKIGSVTNNVKDVITLLKLEKMPTGLNWIKSEEIKKLLKRD